MNKRIKLVRKHFNISQTEFGSKIGVSLGVIKNLEQGKTRLKPPLFDLFCNIYNVNPQWLLTGEGNMFLSTDDLAALEKHYNLSDKASKFIDNFLKMDKSSQDNFLEALKVLIKE